jgi:hypothetical protein
MITNSTRCTCKTKYKIAMAKAAFNRKKTFHQETGHKFKKETSKCYIWSMALYGAETWTVGKVD